MEPLISVIVPIYNVEDYLPRCMDSILRQTYRNLEIICVDDGSTDSSSEILREYAEKDSRIKAVSKENGGLSSARNAGLDIMTGEYVSYIDSDDYVHPQYIELLYRALCDGKSNVSFCLFQYVKGTEAPSRFEDISFDSSIIQPVSVPQLVRDHNLRSYVWGKLFSSELTSGIRFDEELKYSEDSAYNAAVCGKAASLNLTLLPLPLYYYCQRDGSLTSGVTLNGYMQIMRHMSRKLLHENVREDIYMIPTVRRCLNTRYLAADFFHDREAADECAEVLGKVRERLRKTECCAVWEKTVYLALIRFPWLYRLYRIIREPGLLRRRKKQVSA